MRRGQVQGGDDANGVRAVAAWRASDPDQYSTLQYMIQYRVLLLRVRAYIVRDVRLEFERSLIWMAVVAAMQPSQRYSIQSVTEACLVEQSPKGFNDGINEPS